MLQGAVLRLFLSCSRWTAPHSCRQRQMPWVVLLTFTVLSLPLSAQIYKCTDSSGAISYTNNKLTANKCVVMRLPVEPTTAAPKQYTYSAPGAVTVNSKQAGRASTATARDFPKVSSEQQRSKDVDRLRILEKELAAEQKALLEAKGELESQQAVRNGNERNYQKYLDRINSYQEQVTKHERNISDLSSEIGKLR